MDARQRFWLVDSKGLITRNRADAESLPDHVLPYCHDGPGHPDLKSAVAALKPSVLIGISESSQSITFCQDVCRRLATAHEQPIIMPLSLPGERPCMGLRGVVCAHATRSLRRAASLSLPEGHQLLSGGSTMLQAYGCHVCSILP